MERLGDSGPDKAIIANGLQALLSTFAKLRVLCKLGAPEEMVPNWQV